MNPKALTTLPVSSQYLTPSARSKLDTKLVKSPLSVTETSSSEKHGLVREAEETKYASSHHNGTSEPKLFSTIPSRKSPSPSPKRVNGSSPQKSSHPLVPYGDEDEDEEESNSRGYGNQTPKSKGWNSDPSSRNARSPSISSKFTGLSTRTPIKTWAGTESTLTQVMSAERKRVLEKTEDDLYDEELDIGKVRLQLDTYNLHNLS